MGEPVGGVDPGGECLQGGPEAENGALLGHIDDDAGSGGVGTPALMPSNDKIVTCTSSPSWLMTG